MARLRWKICQTSKAWRLWVHGRIRALEFYGVSDATASAKYSAGDGVELRGGAFGPNGGRGFTVVPFGLNGPAAPRRPASPVNPKSLPLSHFGTIPPWNCSIPY